MHSPNGFCSDLIGFQTTSYQQQFLECCTRILGKTATEDGIWFHSRVARTGVFPISIDPDRFRNAVKTDVVKELCQLIKKRVKGRKVIIGLERLDYIKGIPQKLMAFERFLEQNPEWYSASPFIIAIITDFINQYRVGKVLLVQIAIPSRGEIDEYKTLKSQTHQLVEKINKRFKSVSGLNPIYYLEESISFERLSALYSFADVCLITSLRYQSLD